MTSHDVSVRRGAEAGAIGTPFLLHLEWSELLLLTTSRPPQKIYELRLWQAVPSSHHGPCGDKGWPPLSCAFPPALIAVDASWHGHCRNRFTVLKTQLKRQKVMPGGKGQSSTFVLEARDHLRVPVQTTETAPVAVSRTKIELGK